MPVTPTNRKPASLAGGFAPSGGESVKALDDRKSIPIEMLVKRLPKFDGSGGFDGFIRQFKMLCNRAGISEDEKYEHLTTQLKGPAKQWL